MRKTVPQWMWPALAAIAALVAVRGAFAPGEIFYVRDLSSAFLPMHRWARAAFADGDFPLWDPYVGFGQSAIADPVRHLLFPPVLLIRLLAPEQFGFNLAVALPFPFAALGMYLLARRFWPPAASALAGIVFALSGPMLSTGNFLNLSWAAALVPWALWAADRLVERLDVARFAAAAAVFALQFLAGEGVTVAITAVLAVLYAAVAASTETTGAPRRASAGAAVAGAIAAGALLAAIQLLPLSDAVSGSFRAGGAFEDWPIHPLTVVETVAPRFLGDPLEPNAARLLWLGLIGKSFPYLLSLYVGVGALALAVAGAVSRTPRARRLFWTATLALSLLLALGTYNPLFSAATSVFPQLQALRSPAKLAVFAALALAWLCAAGWQSLAASDEETRTARRLPVAVVGALAVAGFLLLAALLFVPDTVSPLYALFARLAPLDDTRAVVLLLQTSKPALAWLLVVGSLVLACLLAPEFFPERASAARVALFAIVALDLLVTNGRLNPTVDAAVLERPEWASRASAPPSERIYVAGRYSWAFGARDPDESALRIAAPEDVPFLLTQALRNRALLNMPSEARLREAISFDFDALWPREYWHMLRRFGEGDSPARLRLLRRSGVRYFVTTEPPPGAGEPLADVPTASMLKLYESQPPVPRATLVTRFAIEPDVARQVDLLFAPEFDPAIGVALAEEPPPAAGEPGPGRAPSAEIAVDGTSEVAVRVAAPDGGAFLVLTDTYDPNWTVEVDGRSAPLLRANGLFRAVHVAAGEHDVRFAYVPRPFYTGAAVSGATAMALAAAIAVGALRRRRSAPPVPDEPPRA